MPNALAVASQPASQLPRQADNDQDLIALWLHGRSPNTQRAYTTDVQHLLAHVAGKTLAHMTLADLQGFADALGDLSDNSRKRTLNSIKSLFTFAHRLGYIQFNVGAALRIPKAKNNLAARILTEAEVHAMIALTPKWRNQVLLRVLYTSAGRVSEVCALTWNDVQPNGDSGQLTLFGKAGKTRTVKVSAATWHAILSLKGAAGPADPVFVSQKGHPLHPSQVHRLVRQAARRAGIGGNVSPHWLRHSHASHALERGAPVTLVRDTLGHSSLSVTSVYAHSRPTDSSALHLTV